MTRTKLPRCVLLLMLASCSSQTLLAKGAQQDVEYNRDVRPILAENCFRCHGPDPKTRHADLRLDDREAAVDYGAIDPDDLESSSLLERVVSVDPELIMPPPDELKQPTAAERDLLKQWVLSGANYESHWAYQPIASPSVPDDAANAIDTLINKRLRQAGLPPTQRADQATLVRRLYLDLIGLPPTTEQLSSFLDDTKPDAYERLVDELIASRHFGERMAVPWLDVVRYADTVGYHGDQNQNVFPYRDWVINAINDNMPFDEFTRLQLAGDLIENPTDDALVASCFNRLNMMTREGGAQPKEYLAKYSADRVRTVAGAWLGSTMGCAECHDHKYDPFTMRDFYSLAAFFADLRQWGVYQDYGYTPNPDLRGWSNDHPFPPEIVVDVPYLKQRIESTKAARDQAMADYLSDHPADSDAWNQWLQRQVDFLNENPNGWTTLAVQSEQSDHFKVAEDGAIRFTSEKFDTATLQVSETGFPISSLAIDLLPVDEFDGRCVNGNASLSLKVKKIDANGKESEIRIADGEATHKRPRYSNTFEIQGIRDVWSIDGKSTGDMGVYLFNTPIDVGANEKLVISVAGNRARHIRLLASPFSPERDAIANREMVSGEIREAVLANKDSDATPWLIRQWMLTSQPQPDRFNDFIHFEKAIRECREGFWPVQVSVSQKPSITRVLPRGDWQNDSGDVVEPCVPSFLPQILNANQERLTRLDLANWLVSSDNPLTARVQMNRLWNQFFGRGLNPILDDMGIQGEFPSHPDVLDWLANEFVASGWDFKHMVKLIVLSDAYQRTSQPTPEQIERDPQNRLLSRQNMRRLEAEIVRDNALAISGLLNPEMGGPPVFPYQPDGYYEHLQFPNRGYPTSTDDRQYRRGVYSHWQRTFLHPMMANFDAPAREECTGMRIEANTPLQALTLLNDPTFVEAARVWAINARTKTEDDETNLKAMFVEALARQPSNSELKRLRELLELQRTQFANDVESAQQLLSVGNTPLENSETAEELAAWTMVARAILNLHETITRY
ncbi:MAG: PSD1 and planctomycete cytochrome C domain-containing protein [Pirellulaceae bacterium]